MLVSVPPLKRIRARDLYSGILCCDRAIGAALLAKEGQRKAKNQFSGVLQCLLDYQSEQF